MMPTDSEHRYSQRGGGSLRNLWVIFETPTDELSERDDEAGVVDYDNVSLLSYESLYSFGGAPPHPLPPPPPPPPPFDYSPKRTTNKRSFCNRIGNTSPLYRSNFESTAAIGVNESNEPVNGVIFHRVGDRWAPNEVTTAMTNGSKPFLSEKSSCMSPPSAKGQKVLPRAVALKKRDHIPRFPTRRVSGGGAVSTAASSVELTFPHLSEPPPHTLKLDHCPRFPRRRVSVGAHPGAAP